MVFSLMCKKDDTEEDDVESDEEELHLQNNEQWMHPIPGTDGQFARLSIVFVAD